MKISLAVLLIVLCIHTVWCQKNQTVVLTKTDGTTVEFETKCRYYQGEYYFPEDGKPTIRGVIDGVKRQISKSELMKITQSDGTEYSVIASNGDFVIGQFITEGQINVFKMYWFGHGAAPGIMFGTGGPGLTMGGSANKTISVIYSEYVNDNLSGISQNQFIAALKFKSPEFEEYAEGKRAKDDKVFEDLVRKYNEIAQ